MRLAHAVPFKDTKIAKFFKSGVAILLVLLIAFSTVFTLQLWNVDAAANNGGQTAYANVSEFQKAQWKNIQNTIFQGGNAPYTPNVVDGLTIKANNGYFNWTDTGLTAWNGSSSTLASSGTQETYTYGSIQAKYTVYNVSTPEQLRYVLANFNSLYSATGYIKINITADMDMGGQNGKIWQPIELGFGRNIGYKRYMYLEGNGHTIYNLKITNENVTSYASGLFSTPPAFMVAKNLGFMSSMVLNVGKTDATAQSALLCAYLPQKMYLYNVHSSVGYFQNHDASVYDAESSGGIGGLVGRKNIVANPSVNWKNFEFVDCGDTFIENCSTEKCYMYGDDHIGGLSSFMSTKAQANLCSYNSDFPETPEQYVFDTAFMSSVNLNTLNDSGKSAISTNSSSYPIMVKNSSSTDCVLFSVGHDSGAFISCGAGIMAEGCFTNNTLYSSDNSGGFIGRIQCSRAGDTYTSKDGFVKDEKGNYTIGSVFRDCYSSGIIEGRVAMGGFVGLENGLKSLSSTYASSSGPYETSAAGKSVRSTIYENCYSTSMVGMDYAGKYVGGFMGLDDNYNTSATIKTKDGKTVTGKGTFYVNCYAAGEVGNILTVTDIDDDTLALEKEYFDNYEGVNTATNNLILDYYPTGGFIGSIGIDNYRTNYTKAGSGTFVNCYYDKQTTAMHEMEIGLSAVQTSGGTSTEKYDIPGVTGLYTQDSRKTDANGNTIEGLTDMTKMDAYGESSKVWHYENEYYPQSAVFMAADIKESKLSDVTESDITDTVKASEFFIENSDDANEYSKPVLSMAGAKNTSTAQAQMAQVIRAYRESQASTSTVLLDHWDITMDTTTGAMADSVVDWEIDPRNTLKQHFVERARKTEVAKVVYKNAQGNEVDNASGATRKEIVDAQGNVLAYIESTSESGKYIDEFGNEIDSVYEIQELALATDEWYKVFNDIDAGSYKFRIKEGLDSSKANEYGKDGYKDDENISLEVPLAYANYDVKIRFHYGSVGSTDYYVYADFYTDYSDTAIPVESRLLAESTYEERNLYVRGSFNNWQEGVTEDAGMTDRLEYKGDLVYSYTYPSLEAGTYEFKIASADYSEEYDQPNNGGFIFTIKTKDSVTFTFDDKTKKVSLSTGIEGNLVEFITGEVEESKIEFDGISVISKQAITGHEWLDPSNIIGSASDGLMTLNTATGLYEKTFTVYSNSGANFDKSYGYRIIEDAIDKGANRYFYLASPENTDDYEIEVTFHYNAETGESYVTTDDLDETQVPQKPEFMEYHVAGNVELTGRKWLDNNADDTPYAGEGIMSYDNATGLYVKEYKKVPAGDHSLKIAGAYEGWTTGQDIWNTGVEFGKQNSGQNYEFTLLAQADITIYLNDETGVIQVAAIPTNAITHKAYVVTGTENLMGTTWNTTDAEMSYNDETALYSYRINDVETGNYAFKVVQKGMDYGANIPFRIETDSTVSLLITYSEGLDETRLMALDSSNKDVTDQVVKDIVIDHYSVLGDKELTGADRYDTLLADEAGIMTKSVAQTADPEHNIEVGDVIWTKVFSDVLAPYGSYITYSFNVAANGMWDSGICYGDGGLNGADFQVTVESTSEYEQKCIITVVFNETEGEVYYQVSPDSYLHEFDDNFAVWLVYGDSGLLGGSSKVSDPLVYDTVRDITKDFSFTAGANSSQRGVLWDENTRLNESYGFKSGVTFDLDYSVKGYDTNADFKSQVIDMGVDITKDNGEDTTESNISDEYSRDSLIPRYSVKEFAPGKTWITVNTIGDGYSQDYIDWKKNALAYDKYQEALADLNNVKRMYLNALSGFQYTVGGNTVTVNSENDNVVDYCKYLNSSEASAAMKSNYDNLVDIYGVDLLEVAQETEALKVGDPGDTPPKGLEVSGQAIYGKRHLRLIPTVYLEAGVDAQVKVINSGNVTTTDQIESSITNIVNVDDNTADGNVVLTNNSGSAKVSTNHYDKYNFALSAGYLITDKIGLGIYKNYDGERIVKYGKEDSQLRNDMDVSQRTDNPVRYFAMSSVFTESPSYSDEYNANKNTYNPKLEVDKLVDQKVIGSAYSEPNAEKNAQTMVQVFKHKDAKGTEKTKVIMDSTGSRGEYVDNYQKWIAGSKPFTAKDTGTYTVTFYWALEDGRYIEDSKEVVVSSLESDLVKDVDIKYTNAGENKKITYTLTYENDKNADSQNYAIFDVLPFNNDTRLKRGSVGVDKFTDMVNDSLNLVSVEVTQSGGSKVGGIYYSKNKEVIRGYMTDSDGNQVSDSATKLEMVNGRITNDTHWNDVTDSADSINTNNVTAIAVTGTELLPGQTIQIKYVIEVPNLEINDYLANNAYYDMVSMRSSINRSDYSNPVTTYAVGRHIEGYAWLDDNGNSVVDSGEPFFTNMQVSLYRKNENGEFVFTGIKDVTGLDGKYQFRNLGEGTYIIVFDGPVVMANGEYVPTDEFLTTEGVSIPAKNLQTSQQLPETKVKDFNVVGSQNIATTDSNNVKIINPETGEVMKDVLFIPAKTVATGAQIESNNYTGINSQMGDGQVTIKNQNVSWELGTTNDISLEKEDQLGNAMSGVDFVLEKKHTITTVDDEGNVSSEQKWYPVYFAKIGELFQEQSDYPMTYDELDAYNQSLSKYTLVGNINGVETTNGEMFEDNKLTVTFDRESTVYLSSADRKTKYFFDTQCTEETGVLKAADRGERMVVPAGEHTFTVIDNADGSVTLTYADIIEDDDEDEKEIITLIPGSDWEIADARFAAYFFNNDLGKNVWVSLTEGETDGEYSAEVPEGEWLNVIFCRMNGASTENDWGNKWNQTVDLGYNGTTFKITNPWNNGGNALGEWQDSTGSIASGEYSLIGFINGKNDGVEEDDANANHIFDEGKLTIELLQDSYVGIKTADSSKWYWFYDYCTEKSGTLYSYDAGANQKMYVPAGTVTFTLLENHDGSLTLSYKIDKLAEGTLAKDEYALFGFINGDHVGYREDYKSLNYRFKNGRLTVNFDEESYVCVKSTDLKKWYWFDEYCHNNIGVLYRHDSGEYEKMYVPAGSVTFTLYENSDGSLKLSYVVNKAKYIFTTNEDGKLAITGIGNGEYRLKELKAPGGFDKLKSAIYFNLPYEIKNITVDNEGNAVVEMDGKSFIDTEGTMSDNDNVVAKKENDDGSYNNYYNHISFKIVDPFFQFSLPETGFDGIFVIALLGFVLMGGSVVLFIVSRKKREKSLKH